VQLLDLLDDVPATQMGFDGWQFGEVELRRPAD